MAAPGDTIRSEYLALPRLARLVGCGVEISDNAWRDGGATMKVLSGILMDAGLMASEQPMGGGLMSLQSFGRQMTALACGAQGPQAMKMLLDPMGFGTDRIRNMIEVASSLPIPRKAPAVDADSVPAAPHIVVDPMGRGFHKTIEQAVSSALPGSTVQLAAGRHFLWQTVTVDRPLCFRGMGGNENEIVLAGTNVALDVIGDGRFELHGVRLTVPDNVSTEDGGAGPFINVRSGEVLVSDCTLQGNGQKLGVQFGGQSRGLVKDCSFDECLIGVYAAFDAVVDVENCACSGGFVGILFEHNADGTMRYAP